MSGDASSSVLAMSYVKKAAWRAMGEYIIVMAMRACQSQGLYHTLRSTFIHQLVRTCFMRSENMALNCISSGRLSSYLI
ncbi:hypothetical protein M404DRAFT_846264 [Pisolithus tinctorius Marx 270]|uniref:Uncharacterized protein n=1 Tax=Pisolithus tinctorius Marx 270 TaxID=870435 RepID=A0A0C3IP05_PISTI|nr:hypothetical protein M404DRAFT_846264 [Pisolithus tinctorius Marx 270]